MEKTEGRKKLERIVRALVLSTVVTLCSAQRGCEVSLAPAYPAYPIYPVYSLTIPSYHAGQGLTERL